MRDTIKWTIQLLLVFAMQSGILFQSLALNACNPPINLQVSDIQTTSVQLSWNVVNAPAEDWWEIAVIPFDSTFNNLPTQISVLNNPFIYRKIHYN